MTFDPQKLFLGLMDFFSILLPGALLTFLFMDEVGPVVLGSRYATLTEVQAWAAFFVASYLFGHLIFLLGSWLDEFYDWARCYTRNAQIALLARRDRLLPRLVRGVIWLVFKGENNLAVNRAGKIKRQILKPLQSQDAINTFQWSKAWLNTQSPASLAVVQRFEADSKFFRSFVVVLVVLLVTWPWQHHWSLAGIPLVLVLLLLALWRYMEQRHKATNQAYWSVIALAANMGDKISFGTTVSAQEGPTHAGGVVYRMRNGRVEYLLVEAKDDPGQWVLPKGHIEEGERDSEAAVREVLEETGAWARPIVDLRDASWSVDGQVITTRFFLMHAIGRGSRDDRGRRHQWLVLQKAVEKASQIETRELLHAADQRRAAAASSSSTDHSSQSIPV